MNTHTHKFATLIFVALLFLIGVTQAQWVEGTSYTTVTIADTTAQDTVYIVRNSGGQTHVSTTLPTSTTLLSATRGVPPSSVVIEPNAGTGMAAGETDSLAVLAYPLIYDYADGEYAVVWGDEMYLNFTGQRATLLKAETWIDWTDGAEYYCALNDSLGVPLYDATYGVALVVKQVNDETGTGLYTIQPLFKQDNK